ncbi:MBL fold metallo-hydrolase [Aquipuribacter sp. SD81]|uniref:MBL fold metallo-hydrolase n=1 Tax=Aquipuribacter sp. SD81 TaxID=3127703 RepID=UPI003015D575
MKVDLLGVRGSTAAPGREFVRYGGHTSCVAVTAGGADVPTLVLDAGTGLRTLTERLAGRPFTGSILLSHLHWDHVQGLPFFAAGDRDDSRADLLVPAQHDLTGRDLLAQTLSPPAFPITPEGLRGRWRFHAWDGTARDVEGFRVRAVDVRHKGGRTLAHRVERDGVSLAYLPDHAPAAGVSDALLELLDGVDLLVHGAQFLDHERPRAVDYGHCTVQEAVDLAVACRVRSLVLFHHSPARTDEALDEIAGWAPDLAPALPTSVGREGDRIVLRRTATDGEEVEDPGTRANGGPHHVTTR